MVAFIKVFRIATSLVITGKEINFIQEIMIVLVHHTKKEYYHFKFHQRFACKPVIHSFLHVTIYIRKMGPIWSYGQ